MLIWPQQFQALMYYLRAFLPYISLQIQNFEVNNLLEVYRQAMSVEAYLNSVGKLPSHMPVPCFPMLAQIQSLRP